MPLNSTRTFKKGEVKQLHYYVFDFMFIERHEAVDFCNRNKIPHDFIVETFYFMKK